jgi:hypothetical protein
MSSRAPVLSCLLAVGVAALPAQTVLTVGPGGFPTIPAALAAAVPGAIVEIAPGVYPAFDCSVGVTLRAISPGTVVVDLAANPFPPGAGTPMQFAAPAGQTIHVVGLTFSLPAASFTSDWNPQVALLSDAVMEDCTLTGQQANAKGSLRVGPGAVVHLQNVTTQGPMLRVEGLATAVQCSFAGPWVLGFTSSAVWLAGRLHASDCSFTGGSSSTQAAGAGIDVAAAGELFAVDCAVQRGFGPGAACAIAGSGTVRIARVASNSPACLPTAAASGLGVQRSGPVVRGAPFAVSFRGGPLFPVGVHLSHAVASVPLPFTAQPWGAPLGASFEVAFGLTDVAGQLPLTFAIPNSPVFVGLPVWLHGWSGWTFPLDVAPPVGGLVR